MLVKMGKYLENVSEIISVLSFRGMTLVFFPIDYDVPMLWFLSRLRAGICKITFLQTHKMRRTISSLRRGSSAIPSLDMPMSVWTVQY